MKILDQHGAWVKSRSNQRPNGCGFGIGQQPTLGVQQRVPAAGARMDGAFTSIPPRPAATGHIVHRQLSP
jgi:hypothetical protein